MLTHRPVLLDAALAGLQVRADGVYVDGTFGRGGHAQQILAQLGPQGRLLVFDKDPAAIAVAEKLAASDARVSVFHASFAAMQTVLAAQDLQAAVDGVLLDLGVSSPQLDDGTRGFSFLRDGPLDMRMNPTQGETAASWLNRARQDEIAEVLHTYGEERYRGRIARHIVEARQHTPITTTAQLAELIDHAMPTREPGKHPATRSFQAIRIFINRELDDLHAGLDAALAVLKAQGRLAVISFHSLEDRIVKRFMRDAAKSEPAGFGSNQAQPARLSRVLKPAKPTAAECEQNPRARSSVLRIAEVAA